MGGGEGMGKERNDKSLLAWPEERLYFLGGGIYPVLNKTMLKAY